MQLKAGCAALITRSATALAIALPGGALAQPHPLAEDVESPGAVVAATYEAIERAPGEDFDWDRFRSLWLPEGLMIPNTEQTGGEFRVMTVDEFIAWVDAWYAENAPIGSPDDQGFVEAEIHSVTNVYGDVAQVFSTYDKRLHTADASLGRGINAMTLVFDDDRWWLVSNVWDEENAAGPIPRKYLPRHAGVHTPNGGRGLMRSRLTETTRLATLAITAAAQLSWISPAVAQMETMAFRTDAEGWKASTASPRYGPEPPVTTNADARMHMDLQSEARKGIDATLAAWASAIRKADLDSIAELVTTDAEFWTHETPPLKGRSRLKEAFAGLFADYAMEQDFLLTELLMFDGYALLRGLEINRLDPRDGGPPLEVRQRAFSLLRKDEDGRWRFTRGMTNAPAPEEDSEAYGTGGSR